MCKVRSVEMSVEKVVGSADAILEQLECFTKGLDDERLTMPSNTVGGTIGMHMRHTLDHYRAALATPASEPIDYDHRERGGNVECCCRSALSEIATLRSMINDLGVSRLTETVTARVMVAADGQTADLESSRARELFFAMHHAIHHNATIKAIAKEHGIECEDCFGKAPSTVNFEQSRA